jgi:hypothetical protein
MPLAAIGLYPPDTISGFERAAQQRFQDGEALRASGRDGGAIYLYGYVVEMVLKAACYRLFGHPPHAPVESARPIVETWIGELALPVVTRKLQPHDLDAWASGLVWFRDNIHGVSYPIAFTLSLGTNTDVVLQYWLPGIRYQELPWGPPESAEVSTAAAWFLTEYPNMFT